MSYSNKHRIATFGLAAVAVIAIQGTVFGSDGDTGAECRTWNPAGVEAGQYQETLHPQHPLADPVEHGLNPATNNAGGAAQHSWNPDAIGHFQQTLHPQHPLADPVEHGLNPATDNAAACLVP
jgi:hypothetical protein